MIPGSLHLSPALREEWSVQPSWTINERVSESMWSTKWCCNKHTASPGGDGVSLDKPIFRTQRWPASITKLYPDSSLSTTKEEWHDAGEQKRRAWTGRAAPWNPTATGLLPILEFASQGFPPSCSGPRFACLLTWTLGVHVWQRRNSSKGEEWWRYRGRVGCPHPTRRQGWQTKRKQTPPSSLYMFPPLLTPSHSLGCSSQTFSAG